MSEASGVAPGKPGAMAGRPFAGVPGPIAAIGEQALLAGFHLAGAVVHACESDPEVLGAWSQLPKDTVAVILTPRSAAALGKDLSDPRSPLTVVLPA